MSSFAIRYPFFILMACLAIVVIGTVNLLSMPVDLFPPSIFRWSWSPLSTPACRRSRSKPTSPTPSSASSPWAANIDHIESRSLTGVSLIKIYFQPGTDANAALSNISNLAMADLRRLPPGTLPPVVLGFDASSQPVCLVTLKGQGLNETASQGSGAVPGAQPDRQCARAHPCRSLMADAIARSWSMSIR